MENVAAVKGAQGASVQDVSPADMGKTESQRESAAEALVAVFGPTKADKPDGKAVKAEAAKERKTQALESWASTKEGIADDLHKGERAATGAGLRLGIQVIRLRNAEVISITQGQKSDEKSGKVNLRAFVKNSTNDRITYKEASRWYTIVGKLLALDAALTFDNILESPFANMSTSALDALKGPIARAVKEDADAEGTPALNDVRRFLASGETIKTGEAIKNVFRAPEVKRTPLEVAERLFKALAKAGYRLHEHLKANPNLDFKGYGGATSMLGEIIARKQRDPREAKS